MYNSNKNKYLVYIMAKSGIEKFKTAINDAYKHLKNSEITVDESDKILKESNIIKQLIDKLNEKSPGADGAGTNNKIAISITKYNYGYYLNTIEDKEYALFLKLFLYIISSYLPYNEGNIINILFINIYLFRYIKLIYKIYKKNIIHINNNNKLKSIIYHIYDKTYHNDNYTYTLDDLNAILNEKTDIESYNVSCKILLTFEVIQNLKNQPPVFGIESSLII